MLKRVPAEVFPPGEFIREELEARGWTQEDLAQIMGRPLRLVNELINAKKQITPETARGLGEAFGTEPIYWMNLDSTYRLSNTDAADDVVGRRARLYRKFPLREMIKRRWIEPSENLDVVEHRLTQFFSIDDIDDEIELPHAAKATQYDERTPIQLAWLYRARQLAESVRVAVYSTQKLIAAIAQLENLMIAAQEIRQVPAILANAGIRFVIVEYLQGAKIDGAAFWLDEQSPVIALSLRFDRINNFWFVLRHEIEHILRKDGSVMIDIEMSERLKNKDNLPDEEIRANKAAAEFCVPNSELQGFIIRVRPLYSEQRILLFSKRVGRHPGIVVGQLQFADEVPYTHFHKHLVKIRQIITQTSLTDGWGTVPPVLRARE